jgi:hypothetical protein
MPQSPFTTDRSSLARPGSSVDNPEFSGIISQNPTFASLAAELTHLREVQAMKQFYIYTLSGQLDGQTSDVFTINIEQGSDFYINFITGSAFSYDATVGHESSFPIPNSLGVSAWAGRGLSVKITDSMAGRELVSGWLPFELFATPGYGLNFQTVFPMRYLAYRNNKIRFDVRNRDNANRKEDTGYTGAHSFEIALCGYKIFTPQ